MGPLSWVSGPAGVYCPGMVLVVCKVYDAMPCILPGCSSMQWPEIMTVVPTAVDG